MYRQMLLLEAPNQAATFRPDQLSIKVDLQYSIGNVSHMSHLLVSPVYNPLKLSRCVKYEYNFV